MLKGIVWRVTSSAEGAAWTPAAANKNEEIKVVSCMMMVWRRWNRRREFGRVMSSLLYAKVGSSQ